jgi:hypothetical protein
VLYPCRCHILLVADGISLDGLQRELTTGIRWGPPCHT